MSVSATTTGKGYATTKQVQFMVEFLDIVEKIREKLEHFDREIADQIRPIALIFDGFDVDGKGTFDLKVPGDNLSNNFIYQQVIDKISQLNFNAKDERD